MASDKIKKGEEINPPPSEKVYYGIKVYLTVKPMSTPKL
jgi:hypothetical protein